MTVDIHALAALPGAGNAEKALKKAGHWNEAVEKAMKIARDGDDICWDADPCLFEPYSATAEEVDE